MAACLDTIDGTLITTKALADLLNVKEATILKYARDDGLERADTGKFELRAAIEWWTQLEESIYGVGSTTWVEPEPMDWGLCAVEWQIDEIEDDG